MYYLHRLVLPIVLFIMFLCNGILLFLCGVFLYLNPQIPSISKYRNISFNTPMRIYSKDGVLIGEYGEHRRIPIKYKDIPKQFLDAVVNTEDKRFFEHRGIDFIALGRATLSMIMSDGISSGASTITMQVARNVSLNLDRVFIRKFKEMLLSLKIENELSKEDILELYLNLIPYGKHAYGAAAAAKIYYDKTLNELTLAQHTMLAGIPKAPSTGNPINNPQKALKRRNKILALLFNRDLISQEKYQQAKAAPVTARLKRNADETNLNALYVAETVRQQMLKQYGTNIYRGGYEVFTTLDSKLQEAANKAVRSGLLAYSKRHGYMGSIDKVRSINNVSTEVLLQKLAEYPKIGDFKLAVVTKVMDKSIEVLSENKNTITISWSGLRWARRFIDVNRQTARPKKASDIVAKGDVLRIHESKGKWQLAQLPLIQGAFVAIEPNNGAVLALIGGYDFKYSQFNYATQGKRQPGSSFKPFIYSAALNNNITPAHVFNDAPLIFKDAGLETEYRPRNSGGEFEGLTSVRKGFYKSINLVSMRMMLAVGINNTLDYLTQLGFSTVDFPQNLQLAIGGGTILVTPLEMATAYSILANGGYQIQAHFIDKISTQNEGTIYKVKPITVCSTCSQDNIVDIKNNSTVSINDTESSKIAKRVMDPRINFQINNMMQDVIKKGTSVKAKRLKNPNIAGKTGTTDSAADTWFGGFNSDITAIAWVGFSNNLPLGNNEFGSTTALPIWIDFMRLALQTKPGNARPVPKGLTRVLIDPATGKATKPSNSKAIFEWFLEENTPDTSNLSNNNSQQENIDTIYR